MVRPIRLFRKVCDEEKIMTTFGDMVKQFGGAPVSGDFTTGNVFFVDSVNGNDTGHSGKTPSQAFATLDTATNACTANNHDIVYIMPNHAETISSATTWIPDVAGVQYIGIGVGADAPELTFSATSSQVAITGGNNVFRNIRFVAGVGNIVAGVSVVSTNHVTIDSCVWDYGTTAYEFVWGLSLDTANYVTVKNCRFIAELDTTGASSAIRLDACKFLTIQRNQFIGEYGKSAIESATTEAASTGIMILDNDIYNTDTAGTYGGGIALRCACTGIIARNMVGWLTGLGSAQPVIDPGSCMNFENYVCSLVDRYAVANLHPATATT